MSVIYHHDRNQYSDTNVQKLIEYLLIASVTADNTSDTTTISASKKFQGSLMKTMPKAKVFRHSSTTKITRITISEFNHISYIWGGTENHDI
jgi:phage terminase large subunit